MQFVVDRAAFAEIMEAALPIVMHRSTVPILSHVRIEAEGNRVTVGANNLEASITHACAAEVRTPGAIALPAAKIGEITRRAVSDVLSISLMQDGRVGVRAGRSKYDLSCLPAADFPAAFTVDAPAGALRMPAAELALMLSRTALSINPQDSRPFCHGVVLDSNQGRLRATGFAGHTFARATARAPSSATFPQIIIPQRTIAEVIKMGRSGSEIEVVADHNAAAFRCGDVEMVSRLIGVECPNWDAALPNDHDDIVLTIDKAEIVAATDRASTVLDGAKRRIGMHVNGQLTLSCVGQDQSRSEEVVENVNHIGDDIEIGFDSTYVRNAMSIMPDRVTWGFGKRSQSLLIRPIDDDSVFYIIMSMR